MSDSAFVSQCGCLGYLYLSWRPLLLRGAGAYAELAVYHLTYRGIGISAVSDGDPAKWGKSFYGMRILDPSEALSTYPGCNVLVATRQELFPRILVEMADMGVPHARVHYFEQDAVDYHFLPQRPSFSIFSNRDFYRVIDQLTDEHSKEIFRQRYRHLLLGDTPVNSSNLPCDGRKPTSTFATVLHDAGAACDGLEEGYLIGRNFVLDFDNNDLLWPRALMLFLIRNPYGHVSFGAGNDASRTKLYAMMEKEWNDPAIR